MTTPANHIELFQSLFKSRQDIYARRWENEGRSGYIPAYNVEWEKYKKHKALGGTFKNFKHKELAPLTPAVIRKHLLGKETIGIYPLLKDNTSWLLAADFDKENWMKESRAFLQYCKQYKLHAYLERSRSGKGGHVWIFFQEPYPAGKSRNIAFHLLRKAGILSQFEKDASFDRLFPNQNYHSGKGFGNLIALPLNKKGMADGNTCFINPETGEPFRDQWKFLAEVQKVPTSQLDQINAKIRETSGNSPVSGDHSERELEIILDKQVWLHKNKIPPSLVSFIREKLNFLNSEYLMKKSLSKSTWQTEKYFNLIGEQENHIIIPRGFLPDLIAYCKKFDVSYHIEDRRRKKALVYFQSNIELYVRQEKALKPTSNKDFGVIVAPPGSGKTIMGLELIARKRQPALIIVHRKQLFNQWLERIESFLGIPEKDIGKFSGRHKKKGKNITVAMIQTLKQDKVNDKIKDSFGAVIVDECHHIPAKTFRETIIQFSSYYYSV
jgi:hypothetical protein